jgi:hypothetical protein
MDHGTLREGQMDHGTLREGQMDHGTLRERPPGGHRGDIMVPGGRWKKTRQQRNLLTRLLTYLSHTLDGV